MRKTVVLVGALDTKGTEFAFVRDLLQAQDLQTLVIDFGVMGQPSFVPDMTRAVVARAGGAELSAIADGQKKDEAMRVMAAGLRAVVLDLYQRGQLDGILGMGGSGGTSLATAAMRALPVGLPKVMISTVGGGDVSAYAGTKDIIFIPSVVDVAGINSISRVIYCNAAAAIAGMVKMERPPARSQRPLIAASMFGNTTACVDAARALLEAQGYEVLVFHATGTGGRTMEALIDEGYFEAALDITTTELADEVCGGVLSAGADRCMAAARKGIPTVLVPGCIDMANFGGLETMPAAYRTRTIYQWNPNVTLLRTNVEENIKIGKMLAAAANAATGPIVVILPLKGVSVLDSPDQKFWDPAADKACYDAIKSTVKPEIKIIEAPHNINDPEFAQLCAKTLLAMLK